MIENQQKSIDRRRAPVAPLTDFSKMFECLPHDLLIEKLHAYGIIKGSLNVLFSYLKNRKQIICLNNTFSEGIAILFGVPQGFINGSLLFDILLCDFFFFLHDIPVAKHADDNTSNFKCSN